VPTLVENCMIEMVGGEVVTLYLFVKINDYSCIMQHMWLEIRKNKIGLYKIFQGMQLLQQIITSTWGW